MAKHTNPDSSVGYLSVDDLIQRAAHDAEKIAPILQDAESPTVEAFVAFDIPYTSGVVTTAAELEEVDRWLKFPSELAGTNALVDTTTIATLTSLLANGERLTPLTLWDLSQAVNALVCYDHLLHFANAEVDDDSMNGALGENVFCSLALPDTGQAYEPGGVRGLFRSAWADTDTLMNRLSENAGRDTLEGKSLQEFAWQWSMILGQTLSVEDVSNRGDSSDYSWSTAGPALLRQLWYESGLTPRDLETQVAYSEATKSIESAELAKSKTERLHGMITECNCRSYVNQRLAGNLRLPYVANTARLPFRSMYYNLPGAVTDALPTVLAANKTYAKRAAHADLLQGDPLVLPVFLALALNNAKTPADLWAAIAGLRTKAARFRQRRAELDHALEVGNQKEVKKIRAALGSDAATLTETMAEAGAAAGKAAITSVATHPSAHMSGHPAPWLATGLSAVIAGARKLIPKETAQRLIWGRCRPDLRFLSDITMDSRAVIDSLPNVQRVWGLSGAQVDEFARRIDDFRIGGPVKKAGIKKTTAKKATKKAAAKKAVPKKKL
jgi:hypothetical protein